MKLRLIYILLFTVLTAHAADALIRQRLAGSWEYLRGDMGSIWEVMRPVPGNGKPEAVPLWTSVSIPHCFNALDAVDPFVNYYQGAGWYRTSLDLDSPYENGRIILEFEGAGQKSEVYVHTQKVGSHTGGYDGWRVDITDAVRGFQAKPEWKKQFGGKVPVAVRCDNSRDVEMIPSDMSDFNLYGGLYRHVNLLYLPASYPEKINITATVDEKGKKGAVNVSLSWAGSQAGGFDKKSIIEISDPYGKTIGKFSTADSVSVTIKNPRLWSPEKPLLYTCRVTAGEGADTVGIDRRFAFRNIRFEKKGPFYLNGKRVLLRGTHRHEDHAGVGAAVTDDMMLHEMKQIKDMGANFIRLGHYQQSERILDLCDSLGIMVWEEIPWCRGGLGGESYREQARRMLSSMIESHASHPSVIMWGMGNENDWRGDFPTFSPDSIRAFMSELVEISHKKDPSRPTVIRRCDFAKDIVDVYSPTIWAGWYSRGFKDYAEMERKGFDSTDRFIHAEWGGDSHAGRHAEETFNDGKSSFDIEAGDRNGDWSESYIVRLFDWHLKEQEKMPWLTGSAFWTFKDFSTPLRPRNPVPYVNQKGVVERDGTPKESYYVFQSYWSEAPMIHIYGHSWQQRWGNKDEKKQVLVYSNCDEAELFVNGISQGKKRRDSQDFPAAGFHWDVTLTPGSNSLEAIGRKDGTTVRDEISQIYQTEKWGAPSEARLSLTEDDRGKLVLAEIVDAEGVPCLDFNGFVEFGSTDHDALMFNQGTATGSRLVQASNGRAAIRLSPESSRCVPFAVSVKSDSGAFSPVLITVKDINSVK